MAGRAELHAAAWRVVEEFRTTGKPFVLHLRSLGAKGLHTNESGVETLLDELRGTGANLVEIQEPGDPVGHGTTGHAGERRAPAFTLTDDEWETYARALIGDADLIISESPFVSGGVARELDFIFAAGAADRTVLLLPQQGAMIAPVDDHPAVQRIPRGVYADQLTDGPFLRSFAVRDLLERLRAIAALALDARLALSRDRARKLAEFPVSWVGVAEGYQATATAQEVADLGGEESDGSWWLRFWSYFRALSVTLLRLGAGQLSARRAAPTLVALFLKLGNLELRTGGTANGITIIRGDLTFAGECARSAAGLATDHRLERLQPLAERLLDDVGRIRGAAAARPDRILLRPRHGPIATRPADARSH